MSAAASQLMCVCPLAGSRIGVLFVPTANDPNRAEMHFIINGYDQGPCTKDIPYKEGALHAVVDVYGTTKQVRVIQLYGSKCWVGGEGEKCER